MQKITCGETSLSQKLLSDSCIDYHKHHRTNQQKQQIQRTTIDFHQLNDFIIEEPNSKDQRQSQFEKGCLKKFISIKEEIIGVIFNLEDQLIQLLSSIKVEESETSICKDQAEKQQLHSVSQNKIRQKQGDKIEENENNYEEENFQSKELSFDSLNQYHQIESLLSQMNLALEMIQFKGEKSISNDLIEQSILHQSQSKQQIVFSLSIVGNEENKKYEAVFWDTGKIVKKYSSQEYEFEFSSPDIIKNENLNLLTLNIKKKQRQIVQVEQQIDFENFNFNHSPSLLIGHTSYIYSVAISDNQQYLASGGCEDGKQKIFIWDLQSKKNIKKYKGPQNVNHLSFSRDSNRLAAAGTSSRPADIFIFDMTDLERNDPIQVLKGHSTSIARIVFTQNSKNLISGSWDSTLRVWNVDDQKETAIKKCTNFVYGVALSNNEKLIGCCCYGGLAYLFDSKTLNALNEKIPPWQAHQFYTNSIEFIQDSQILLTSGATEIRLWSVQDLLQMKTQHLKEIKSGENNLIWTVKAYPVSNPKVVVGCDGKIKIWNLEDTQLKQTIEVQGGLFQMQGCQFALTSDLKKIITGGNDKNIKIYEKVE